MMTGKGIGRGGLAIFAVPADALAASTVGSQPRPTPSVPVLSTPIRPGDGIGTQVYARTCAYCHDHGVGPAIKGRELDPAAVRLMVRHGALAMPAFRQTEISEAELDAVGKMLSESK
ncbi:MAG: c-type cytochrome [Novosphingobium sp.]